MKLCTYRKMKALMLFAITVLILSSCSDKGDELKPIKGDFIQIPDAVFESMLIEKGIDSEGMLDKKILTLDAEKITHLNLNFSGSLGEIRDLKGIEGFKNLRFLSAAQHNIESIDLSLNVNLDSLSLQGNNLSQIDLSANTSLTFVDLQANEIHSIYGLAKAENLQKLNVSFNKLRRFNLNNKALEVLSISHNFLDSLDIRGALNLKSLLAISNELPRLDVSSNLFLETLLISDNHIQNIRLEKNHKLRHLYITSNRLIDLNVRENLNLIDLRVDRNPGLNCIEIGVDQAISTVVKSDYQELNSQCN